MYKARVITVSDRCYNGLRDDLSGPVVRDMLISAGYIVDDVVIVPDETEDIKSVLINAVKDKIYLIITTGGTGFSKRDVTPEATKAVISREAPGISEYMRYKSFEITKRAMLSRSVCGIADESLIINLPGSPKAAKENLESILDTISHGLDMITCDTADCAKLNK